MKAQEQALGYLRTLGLQGIVQGLDELVNDAESRRSSYLAFLNAIFSAEIDYRVKRRVERNLTGAHFPVAKRLEDFDFGRVKGIGRSEAVNLLDCRWIDTKQNLLFFGPPGIGKTHLAIAFGRQAVEKGYKVCFERVTNLIKMLKTAEVQKTSEYRIRRIMKSELVIIDEIGYTPIEKREANLFFNMISELYEKVSAHHIEIGFRHEASWRVDSKSSPPLFLPSICYAYIKTASKVNAADFLDRPK